MANELDKSAQKAADKDKKAKQLAAMKATAAKKTKKSPIQYFKEVKSEFKKVSWPSRKQVFNSACLSSTKTTIPNASPTAAKP